MKGVSKDIRQIVKELEKQGFSVEHTKNGHLRVRDQEGRPIYTMPSTPSCWRATRNAIAELRRRGFVWKDR